MDDQFKAIEYQEAGENMRHYGNITFAVMTVYVAITGGLLWLVATPPGSGDSPASSPYLVRVTGLLLTLAFALMQLSASNMWYLSYKRAKEIESSSGASLYNGMVGPGFLRIRAGFSVLGQGLFYFGAAFFWVGQMVGQHVMLVLLFAGVGTVIILWLLARYWLGK